MNLKNIKAALDGESVDITEEINKFKDVLDKSYDPNIKFKFDSDGELLLNEEDQALLNEKIAKSEELIDNKKLNLIKKEDELLQVLAKMITFAEEIDKIVVELNELNNDLNENYSELIPNLDKSFITGLEVIRSKYCQFAI